MIPRDLVTESLAAGELDANERAEDFAGDARTWRAIALEALAQLHTAHVHARQYAARLASLREELRRLRGPSGRAA